MKSINSLKINTNASWGEEETGQSGAAESILKSEVNYDLLQLAGILLPSSVFFSLEILSFFSARYSSYFDNGKRLVRKNEWFFFWSASVLFFQYFFFCFQFHCRSLQRDNPRILFFKLLQIYPRVKILAWKSFRNSSFGSILVMRKGFGQDRFHICYFFGISFDRRCQRLDPLLRTLCVVSQISRLRRRCDCLRSSEE